jgi:hypothetical protein
MPILDSVHICCVVDLIDRHLHPEVEIRWSADRLKAGLLINEHLYAMLDFAAQKAFSRGNFPPVCGASWRQKLSGQRRALWKTRRIWITLPSRRYGAMKGVLGITNSRVPGTLPGRPISVLFGSSTSTLWMI